MRISHVYETLKYTDMCPQKCTQFFNFKFRECQFSLLVPSIVPLFTLQNYFNRNRIKEAYYAGEGTTVRVRIRMDFDMMH